MDGGIGPVPGCTPRLDVHKPEYRDGNRGTRRGGVNHLCAVRAPRTPFRSGRVKLGFVKGNECGTGEGVIHTKFDGACVVERHHVNAADL